MNATIFLHFFITLITQIRIVFSSFYNKTLLVFLDAATHLYKRSCPSVGRSVRLSVHQSVRRSVTRFFCSWKTTLKWLERIRSFLQGIHHVRTPSIKTSMSAKMSNWSRIVVPNKMRHVPGARWTDQQDRPTDRKTNPHKEMRGHI